MPSVDMLIQIATTFSVSTDYLLGLDDRSTLDVTGLTQQEISHLRNIINDLRSK